MTLEKTEYIIELQGITSSTFKADRGLRQGDPLSTLLFNLTLEKIVRESGICTNGTIYNRNHQCIAYADDVAIIARSHNELQKVIKKTDPGGRQDGFKN